MGKTNWCKLILVSASLFALPAARSGADDLLIGVASEATSMDPHFHNLGSNIQISKHIFETLIDQGAQQQLIPALAVTWKLQDPNTWELRLREGVTFHDGSPFTAKDVAFTLARAHNVPGSPSSFAPFVRQIEAVQIVDNYTIHLKTKQPYPLLPNDLSNVFIVSKTYGEGASTTDYNSGKAAVGTGPYKFASYVPGDGIRVVRNDRHWGKAATWDQVIFRTLTSDSSRVTAFLAGDVDLIEQVPPPKLWRRLSHAVTYRFGPSRLTGSFTSILMLVVSIRR